MGGVVDDIHRQNRYLQCIQQLLKLIENDVEIKPIIVENNGLRQTYLNDLDCDIVYTDNNLIKCVNKGGNELLDIKEVINKYKIQDDDFVIKLTGRYKLLNLNFINQVKKNIHTHEAFIKFYNVCTRKYLYNDCILGLFCIKCKYLKEFNYNFINGPEIEFATYLRNNIHSEKKVEIKKLDLECCFANSLRMMTV
jgi:hypothetical protein